MKLYFFRHALAEQGDGTNDFARALTKEGIERTEATAPLLPRLDVEPARLYTSPLMRARQTAELLAPALKVAVEVREELSPGFNARILEMLTDDMGEDEDLLLVGHEPDFSTIIQSLTGGSVLMKKGGLARVDVTTRQPLLGELVWLIAPKVFMTLARHK